MILSEREFPASVYPWLRLQEKGVLIKFAATDDGIINEDAIIGLADDRTRVIHTSWVQFNNGNRVDLARLGEFCRKNNILLSVDGIQGTGVIPIDVPACLVDQFSVGCQKWMLGPCGTGFFYLSPQAEAQIEPPYSGWMSVDWKSEFTDLLRYNLEPRTGPAKYEIGTYPFQDLRALNAAVDILLSFDRQKAWDHVRTILDRLIAFVDGDSRFKLVSPKSPERRSAIVTFRAGNTRALYEKLRSLGFVVSYREGGIRVSPHFYNTLDEIERLIDAVRKFSG